MIEVGALSTLVMSEVATAATILVGDGIAPREGGWVQGQPNVDAFRPYTVLTGGVATPAPRDRMVPSHSEWFVTYQMRTFGGSPAQLRTVSQQVRNALDGIDGSFGTSDVFKIVHLHFDRLGGLVRDDSVDPPYWGVDDVLRIEVSRSRNQP